MFCGWQPLAADDDNGWMERGMSASERLDGNAVDVQELVFDPGDPGFQQDPYPVWKSLRDRGLWRAPHGFWIASRFEDVAFIARDRRFGRDWRASLDAVQGKGWEKEPIWQYSLDTMLFRNPPEHTQLRALFTKAFSARNVYAMEPRMRAICEEYVEAAARMEQFDFCAMVALPYPVRVVCEMTGVPVVDVERVAKLVEDLLLSFEVRKLTRAELDLCNDALAELEDMFGQLLVERRHSPREDLLTFLATAGAEQGFSDRLIVWNLIHVFAAAFETTAGVIGNALYAALSQPGLWQTLRTEGMTDSAVEELLRFDLSTQIGGRNALERIEYQGQVFEPGDAIFLALGAACRDERVYSEPDRIDITRKADKPLVFGGGIHMCLGALLARTELKTCFEVLLERFPALAIADGFHPRYRPSATIRILENLPLVVGT